MKTPSPPPPPAAAVPSKSSPSPAAVAKSPTSEDLQTVLNRQKMYEAALLSAKQAGESSKARRYERSMKAITTMVKQLKNGKKVDMDDLPPPVATGGGGEVSKPVLKPVPTPAPRQTQTKQGKPVR